MVIKQSDAVNSPAVGVLAGYQYQPPSTPWLFASQLTFDVLPMSATDSTTPFFPGKANSQVKLSLSKMVRLTLLAGYQVNARSTLLLGPTFAMASLDSQSSYSAGRQGTTGKYQKNLAGVGVSFGLATMITDHWGVKFAINEITFNKAAFTAEEPVTSASGFSPTLVRSCYSPTSTLADIQLTYLF